ncbi:DMT family transporter [Crenobacter intestini]|nr:DMT family transporter [Crenobacter intestini]
MRRALGMGGRLGSGIAARLPFGRVEGLLLAVALIWGVSYSVVKVAVAEVSVAQLLLLRFGLTFLLLLPALGVLVRQWRAAAAGGALLLGVNLLAIFACESWGVAQTSAANAAFLVSLCVAFTPLCEWWLLGERPGRHVLLAALVSVLGALLLAFAHGDGLRLPGIGDALMVLAACLRALMVCLTRRHGDRHGWPALTMTAVQMGVMAAGSATLMAGQFGTDWPALPVSRPFWAALAFLVLLCTLFAFFAQNYAASRTSASRVALLTGSEPLWGALVAVLWLGEPLSAQGWLGGALIVAAAWWVSRPGARRG